MRLTSVCEESIKTVEKNQISDELLTYPIIFIYKKKIINKNHTIVRCAMFPKDLTLFKE